MAGGPQTHDQSLEATRRLQARERQDTIRSGAWLSCHPGVGLQVGWGGGVRCRDHPCFLLCVHRYLEHIGITFQLLLLRTQPSGLPPNRHTLHFPSAPHAHLVYYPLSRTTAIFIRMAVPVYQSPSCGLCLHLPREGIFPTPVHIHLYTYTSIHIPIHISIYTYTYTHIPVYITYTHTYIYSSIHIHLYI